MRVVFCDLKFRKNLFLLLLFLIGFFFTLLFPHRALAATYTWNQDDWSGGTDTVSIPNHTSDQSNWNKYYSKDVYIIPNTGSISLQYSSDSVIQNQKTQFDSGSFSDIESINDNSIKLSRFSGASQISLGSLNSCALKADGTVYCWGYNGTYQLGIGTSVNQKSPVPVHGVGDSGYLTNISQVSSSSSHTCALKTDGTLYCWGKNDYGQLGNGNKVNQSTPNQVRGVGNSGYLTDIMQVSVGIDYTCALKTDGTVYCLGNNSSRVIGDNTSVGRSNPVQVHGVGDSGYLTGITQISSGEYQVCALKNDGTVYCWGTNNSGQLGIGNTSATLTPVQVHGVGDSGYLTGITQIKTGLGKLVCALKTDGTVYCWGWNAYKNLGDPNNSASYSSTPLLINNLTDISQLSIGLYVSCALKTDGTAYCWGYNTKAQIGDGNFSGNYAPTQLKNYGGTPLASLSSVSIGSEHICALKTDGTIYCWGSNNSYGQLGVVVGNALYWPGLVKNPTSYSYFTELSKISVGNEHVCSLKTDGTVYCWGYNRYNQLGIGNTQDQPLPSPVHGEGNIGYLSDISLISSDIYGNCALKINGNVYCWGFNSDGQLGVGNTQNQLFPTQVHGVGDTGYLTDISQIDSSSALSCAVKTDDTAYCWGNNSYGQLGDNSLGDKYFPIQVHGIGNSGYLIGVTQVSIGNQHTCALKTDGTVYCWGRNSSNQLGDNTSIGKSTPVQVHGVGDSGFLTNVIKIAKGYQSYCAIKSDNTAFCWGQNSTGGRLGSNSSTSQATPVQVHGVDNVGYLNNVVDISTNSYYGGCAIAETNTAYCWSSMDKGRLGVGSILGGGDIKYPVSVYNPNNEYWQFNSNNFRPSGNFISSPIDLGGNKILDQISLGATTPDSTSVKIQLRSSDTLSNLSSQTWYGPTGTDDYYTSTTAINQAVSGKRYLQYQAVLETSLDSISPNLNQIKIDYSGYANSGVLISSPFDSQSNENLVHNLSWIKATPDNTSIKFQLRSAGTIDSILTSNWVGPDGTSNSYFTNYLGGETAPASLRDQSNDRYVQYRALLESTDGNVTPTLYNTSLIYVVNAPPDFQNYYQTNGFGVSRSSTPGQINFLYGVGDSDTDQASAGNQYKIWPTFQYTIDNGETWTTISASNLIGPNSDNPIILTSPSEYTQDVTMWNVATDLPNTYTTAKIRMILNDHEAANNTSIITSDAFIIDTKIPEISTLEGGGQGININKNATTSLAADKTNSREVTLYFGATDDSSLQLIYSTNSNFTNSQWQDYTTSVGYTLSSGDGNKRIYVKYKDLYGNESDVYSDIIQLDTSAPTDQNNLLIQDVTSRNSTDYKIFFIWDKSTSNDWLGYKVYRSENGIDFTYQQSITNLNMNYLVQSGLTLDQKYYYKIINYDDLNNESVGSTIFITAGQNPNDSTSPKITNVLNPSKTTTSATITWTTDEVSTSTIIYSTDLEYTNSQSNTGYTKNHSVILTGLSPGTTYNYKIRSSDASGNASESSEFTFTTNQPDITGPIITGIEVDDITQASATINYTTNELATSFVEYSTDNNFTDSIIFGQNGYSYSHSIVIKNLIPATTYYFRIKSKDISRNQTTSSVSNFITSTATVDFTGPAIYGIEVKSLSYNSATIGFISDEKASSFVEFGKDSSFGRIAGTDDNVTVHEIILPYDLSPDTIYYYRIRTKDSKGNETIGATRTFTTSDNPNDLISPIITNINISEAGQNSVFVTWSTNEIANSYVDFSQDLSFSQSQGKPSMDVNHAVILYGLKPKTQYYLRIRSTDPSGNLSFDNNNSNGYLVVTADGENPPTISANSIRNVTENSANIYWETNLQSDSYVEYGLDESFGKWIGSDDAEDTHSIQLGNLISGVTYSFRVRSKTSNNAESVSQNYTLTTKGIASTTVDTTDDTTSETSLLNTIKNSTEDFIRKIIRLLPETKISEKNLIDDLDTTLPKIISNPSVSSSNIIIEPGVDKITISWTTDKNSNSIVAYSSEKEYDSTKSEPYITIVGNPDDSSVNHSVEITNLTPNTIYHYQVRSKSDYGDWSKSQDSTFGTLSINSEIKDLRFSAIKEKSINVDWITSFESRAMVEVIDVLSGKSIVKSEEKGFVKSHSFTTDKLQTSTNYQLKITSIAKDGTVSESSNYPFSTSTSSNPPEISNIRISNALIPNVNNQVQTIISWKTDKPSSSRIFYDESSAKELKQFTNIDKTLVTDHIVVTTNFKSGKVYKIKVESSDANQNTSISKDYLVMTPKEQESVINLIINNFTKSFSFLGKFNK